MKNLVEMKRMFFLFVIGGMMLQGCAVYSPSSGSALTVPEIVRMSKDKVPSKDIIRQIRNSHTVYRLNASEFAKLQGEGVSDSVVNYMQKTHLDAIRWRQQMDDYRYGWLGYYDNWYGGLGFGYPYGYLSWYWPPVILNFHDGYHGGYHDGGIHRERR